jgi:hypothetical protein
MSNFGGRLSQPKKLNIFWGFLFFCQHNSTGGGFLILKQIIDFLFVSLVLCLNALTTKTSGTIFFKQSLLESS